MSYRIFLKAGYICAITMALGACSFDTPTKINVEQPIQVRQDSFRTQDRTDIFTGDVLRQISRHYWSHGSGPLFVTVAYDPASKTNTAARARQDAKRIATGLKAEGVQQIQADILPVEQSGDESQTIIAYGTLEAMAPEDCPNIMNRNFSDLESSKNYRLGCSMEGYMARQIARPRDLLGNDVMDNGDGRRASNVVDPYQGGQPAPALKGETASGK
jgi:pilus biogenesis lipoprotein CpaD